MDVEDSLKAAILSVRAAKLFARVSGMNAENQVSAVRGNLPEFRQSLYERAIDDELLGTNDISEVLINHLEPSR